MTAPNVGLFPLTSFTDVISQIAELTEDAFQNLKRDLEIDAFDSDEGRISRLAEKLSLSTDATSLLLSAISILRERVALLPSDVSAKEAIERFVNDFESEAAKDVNSKNILILRISELTAPSPEIESQEKIRRLRAGFLDNAESFSTFVDLRPDFAMGYDSVHGFVPMIQMKITTDSEDASRRNILIQLDEAGLASLKKAIESIDKKLVTLQDSKWFLAPRLFKTGNKNER